IRARSRRSTRCSRRTMSRWRGRSACSTRRPRRAARRSPSTAAWSTSRRCCAPRRSCARRVRDDASCTKAARGRGDWGAGPGMSEERIAALAKFWNARYAGEDYAYGTEPNDFLVAQAPRLPAGLPVLCLADGEGRNGVWLASRGFDVTSVDVAQQGLDKAQALARRAGVAIETVRADVARYELGEDRRGGIVSI